MCEDCKKFNLIFAETQLECLKHNKIITKIFTGKCDICGINIFIASDIVDDCVMLTYNDDVVRDMINK